MPEDRESMGDEQDLEFLRQVLRDLTHEIAAPLTPLFGHLDLLELRARDQLTPTQMRCIHAMRRSLRRLTSINDRILELARVERGHIPFQPADIEPQTVVAEVLRRFTKAAQAREITLQREQAAPEGQRIRGDWNLLVIAFGHLVENALRHTPDGGTVTVAVEPADGQVAIQVADRGPGVDERELTRIVQPFYRIMDQDAYTETAGLGLTVVALIARRHDARLELSVTDPKSDPDRRGLTARLVLDVLP